MTYRSSQQWVAALERAAAEFLAQRPGVADPAAYRLEASDCGSHGPGCVHVVYAGAIIQHVAWQQEEPAILAVRLLLRMLGEPDGARARRPGRTVVPAGEKSCLS